MAAVSGAVISQQWFENPWNSHTDVKNHEHRKTSKHPGNDSLRNLTSGNVFEKIFWTIVGYCRRISDLFRIPFYNITYIFLWGTPFGSSLYERIVRMFSKKLIYDIDQFLYFCRRSIKHVAAEKTHQKSIFLLQHVLFVLKTCCDVFEFKKFYFVKLWQQYELTFESRRG